LFECQHLSECEPFHKKKIPFSKTINGKTLKDYLFINDNIRFETKYAQTDFSRQDYTIKIEQSTQTTNLDFDKTATNVITSILPSDTDPAVSKTFLTPSTSNSTLKRLLFEDDEESKNTRSESSKKSNRKSLKSKRKSNLIASSNILTSPTNIQTQNYCSEFTYDNEMAITSTQVIYDNIPNECGSANAAVATNPNDIEENIEFDIDAFIKSLCEKDFPEKLAQSINELNIKKLATSTSLDDVRNFSNLSNISFILNNNNTNNNPDPVNNNNLNEPHDFNQPTVPCNTIAATSILETNLDNLEYDLLIKTSSQQAQQPDQLNENFFAQQMTVEQYNGENLEDFNSMV
jgi:hypothetical protein